MAAFNPQLHPRKRNGQFREVTGTDDSKAKEIEEQEKAPVFPDFRKITYRQNTPYWRIMEDAFRKDLPDRIKLPDETLPHSVGAKWANYKINMGDGTFATFQEGSKLQDKEVFAGKGCRRVIDEEDRLLRQYGGKRGQWKKVKAKATVVWKGTIEKIETHWYEEDSIGKIEFKFSKWV